MRPPKRTEWKYIAYALLSEGYGGGPYPVDPMPEGWAMPENVLWDPETGQVAVESQAHLVEEE